MHIGNERNRAAERPLARMARRVGMASALLLAAGAQADVVNLTAPNSSGTINGALFSTAATHSSGTGVVDSFVRLHANGTESGYNTSIQSQLFGRDEVGGNFTHDITLGQIGTTTVDGTEYYQFILDVNEPNGGGASLLSLDDVQIYTSSTAHTDYKMTLSDLGDVRYSMDAGGDSRVELDDFNSGSGTADMAMLVPVTAFAGVSTDSFVYLFSNFGDNNASNGGFEEWWTHNPELIPLPAAAWLGLSGLIGLAGLGMMRRRRLADVA